MKLDYGSGIPLYLIKNPEQAFKTVVITPADKLELEEHLALGKKIGELLKDNPRQTALIVSGNLSHRLKRKSPGGYSPRGSKFDNKIIEYLSEPETAIANLLKMDKRLVLDASECALRPLMIALGILENYYYEPDILAYQTDFGVGYLSLEFILKNEARVEAKADAEKEETKLSKQKLNFNPIPLKEL
jgi:aromatic ring-opening dioxygenase LigB subunit